MIVVNIKRLAEARGITNAYQLQKALEVQPSVAARLWKGEFTKISLDTLNKLCRLMNCQPDKLLRYEPDKENRSKAKFVKERA
jgi:DNA-binding Xre family transcriptional regulator